MSNELYRIDYGYNTVYQYDEDHEAYLFYAKINMLTEDELAHCVANQNGDE